MSKASLVTSESSMELLVDSVTEIVKYSEQKTRYECAQIVRAKLRELRVVDFDNRALEAAHATVLLHRLTMKLQCLEIEIGSCPTDLREVWQPLVEALKNKINATRAQRNQRI